VTAVLPQQKRGLFQVKFDRSVSFCESSAVCLPAPVCVLAQHPRRLSKTNSDVDGIITTPPSIRRDSRANFQTRDVNGSLLKVIDASTLKTTSKLSLFVRLRPMSLTKLKFSAPALTAYDLSILTTLIPGNLQHLDVSHLGLTTAAVVPLAKRLGRTHIQSFNISHNPIGDGSVWTLLL
jgi:hypothetical protein